MALVAKALRLILVHVLAGDVDALHKVAGRTPVDLPVGPTVVPVAEGLGVAGAMQVGYCRRAVELDPTIDDDLLLATHVV